MTPAADATLAVECPTCHAQVDQRCVYVLAPYRRLTHEEVAAVPSLRTRVGRTTLGPHAERYNAVRGDRARQRRARLQQERRRRAEEELRVFLETQHKREEIASIRTAIREFDQREHEALYLWLHEHGHIFTEH